MAIIDTSCKLAIIFAKTLNPDIEISNGSSWIWANGFKSKEDAEEFDKYCNNNNCETRGVYGNASTSYGVRFR